MLGSDKLIVKRLLIRDNASRATIGLTRGGNSLTISFKGNLNQTTLDQVMTENPWLTGWLKGDFKAHIEMEHLLKSAVWGELEGQGISYPLKPDSPLKINDLAVTATTHKISLQSADVSFSGNQLKVTGSMTRSAQNALLDMDISADSLDLNRIIDALNGNGDKKRAEETAKSNTFPIQGNIRLTADRFNIGRFTWQPLHADIRLKNDTADITLQKAELCGISTPGTLRVSPPNIDFDIKAEAKDLELDPAKACLAGGTFKADGTFNLEGRFQGRGKAGDLLKTSTGLVEFTAADGHIYHDVVMLEVLKFLNTLDVFNGQANVKDMKMKGFDYHSFRVKAKFQDGKLRYDEAVLHGRPMVVTAAGEHDLQTEKFNLTLLVAPLVALHSIFEHIPLIGGILDALDTIPLSAKGTVDNIRIRALAPSAIGYELQEMMKKTVERPINLVHGGRRPRSDDRGQKTRLRSSSFAAARRGQKEDDRS